MVLTLGGGQLLEVDVVPLEYREEQLAGSPIVGIGRRYHDRDIQLLE